MSRNSIEGKVVLIAGGAKNLGGLLAREFAGSGAKAVAIHYNSDATKAAAEDTVAAIKSAGAEAVAFQADLTSAAAMEKLFADTVAAVGRPDIAINTVGMVVKKPMAEVSEEIFRSVLRGQRQIRLLLPERGWQARQRQRENLHHRDLAFGSLYAFLCGL